MAKKTQKQKRLEKEYDNAYALWWRADKVLAHARVAGSFEGISFEQAKKDWERTHAAVVAAENALDM
jgi:hypothetical protein